MPTSEAVLIELYKKMLLIRLAEKKIVEVYPTDKIQSPVHLSFGQEGISAGVGLAMKRTDHLYGTYRNHGIYIAKGGDLKKMFAELYGKDTGCARGKGGSMHLVAPDVGLMGCSAIVGSTIPIATGDALASSLQGRERVVVAFFGDGAVDEGVFYESINFAALKNLPIIFVCENNEYAIHSKVADRHKNTQIYQYGESLGVPGKRFNGNDADEVYETMSEEIEKIRKGSGPVLLEYMTYRWYEHVGPGIDHSEAYRLPGRYKTAQNEDPLVHAAERLKKIFKKSIANFEGWEKEITKAINEAVAFAEKSPYPDKSRLYEDLFMEIR